MWCHSPPCGVTAHNVVSQPNMWCHSPPCGVTPQYVVSQLTMWCHSPLCGVTAHYVVSQPTMWCHSPLCGATTNYVVPLPTTRYHSSNGVSYCSCNKEVHFCKSNFHHFSLTSDLSLIFAKKKKIGDVSAKRKTRCAAAEPCRLA